MTVLLPFRRYLLGAAWCRNLLWKNARAVPSLDLDFAGQKSLKDGISNQNLVTFTRASSGTYVGSDGLVKTAVTNLVLRSEEFNDAAWTATNAGITPNATTAPNGTLTADKHIPNNGVGIGTGASQTRVYQTPSFVSGLVYTFSIYAKQGEYDQIALAVLTSPSVSAVYSLTLGTVVPPVAGATIDNVGNGWYRCNLTFTATSTSAFQVRWSAFSSTVSFGDGVSGIFAWGAQLEQASTVGEYVPTTSTINSAPRFDHNPATGESLGLLVEEPRTNLSLYSEGFGNATYTLTSATVSTNTAVAPDGTTTADTVSSSGTAVVSQSFTKAASAITYTGSLFVKGSVTDFSLTIDDGATVNRGRARFNLATGTSGSILSEGTFTGTTGTITSFPDGWYKLTITTTTNTLTTARLRPFWTGAGTSIDFWGAQLEVGAFPTSYIPTTTATVTRAADVASITGSNFSSFYNQTEGTVFADAKVPTVPPAASLSSVFALSDGTTSNRITVYKRANADTSTRLDVQTSGSSVAFINAGTFGLSNLTASCYRLDDFAVSLNGLTPGTDTLGAVPTVSRLNIGSYADAAFQLNGTIKRLTYWPVRLPNTSLQAITQP